jgi:hypothetical protein
MNFHDDFLTIITTLRRDIAPEQRRLAGSRDVFLFQSHLKIKGFAKRILSPFAGWADGKVVSTAEFL